MAFPGSSCSKKKVVFPDAEIDNPAISVVWVAFVVLLHHSVFSFVFVVIKLMFPFCCFGAFVEDVGDMEFFLSTQNALEVPHFVPEVHQHIPPEVTHLCDAVEI